MFTEEQKNIYLKAEVDILEEFIKGGGKMCDEQKEEIRKALQERNFTDGKLDDSEIEDILEKMQPASTFMCKPGCYVNLLLTIKQGFSGRPKGDFIDWIHKSINSFNEYCDTDDEDG